MSEIRCITEETRPIVTEYINERWYSDMMVLNGEIIDMTDKPGYLILKENRIEALLTYRCLDSSVEILSIDVENTHLGTGTELISHFEMQMRESGVNEVMVVTTNDNDIAKRFYEKNGYSVSEIRYGAVNRSRILKPEIPYYGYNGQPVEDEIVYRKALNETQR